MYTKQEYDRYAAMLRESGITEEEQIKSILDFVYRLSVIAADIYVENLNKPKDGAQEETQEGRQCGPD